MSRSLSLILLGFAALFALLGGAVSAAAADNFGAIAFSSGSGATGHSYDYDSRDGAEERALQECGPGCKVVLWFKNACGALAVGDGSGFGTGWASSRSEAENLAMGYCRQNTGGCQISRWACTTR
jgi:hypothetical protein